VFTKNLNDQLPDWYDELPVVDHFFTLEGMLNYSKLYLPNIYDRLCNLKEGPILQKSINHHFGPSRPVDGYLEMLWLWIKKYPYKTHRAGTSCINNSPSLIELERHCRGDTHKSTFEDEFVEWSKQNNLPLEIGFEDAWPIGDEPNDYYMKLRKEFRAHH
jgi:hypothetical protein